MSEQNALQSSFLQPIDQEQRQPITVEEPFLPMVQGTATNRFRATATKNLVLDMNGNATIEEEGFKAFFRDYSKLKVGLGTGAKKLLDAGTLILTRNNHYRPAEGQPLDTAVSISLEEYGRMRGYDLTPRKTTTDEEKTAEKNRIENVLRDIRKKAKSELELLYCLSLSWKEPGKKGTDFDDVRVLQRKGIRGGYINMRFSEDIAAYLMHSYMMQYPIALQASDERNPRSYNVGYKLALQHSMDNNRARGTTNIISVKALLEACGDIPTYEEVQASKDRGHWERRIKDPLTAALDSNVATGVISCWEYSNSKGVPLDDQQVSIADYKTFIDLYVHFEMEGEPDQSERLQRKAERKEKAKATRKRKKPKGGGE